MWDTDLATTASMYGTEANKKTSVLNGNTATAPALMIERRRPYSSTATTYAGSVSFVSACEDSDGNIIPDATGIITIDYKFPKGAVYTGVSYPQHGPAELLEMVQQVVDTAAFATTLQDQTFLQTS